MRSYAGLESRKRRFNVSPFCARWLDRNGYDAASGSEVLNVMAEKKAKKLERARDSVKDRMFSLSDISHFSTKHARRNKPCRV